MASSRKLIIGGIAAAGIVVLGVVLFLVFHHAPKVPTTTTHMMTTNSTAKTTPTTNSTSTKTTPTTNTPTNTPYTGTTKTGTMPVSTTAGPISGQMVLVVGGIGQGSSDGVASTMLYYPMAKSANKWQAAPDMSSKRAYFGAAAVGTSLYAVGGMSNPSAHGRALNSVERFDHTTNEWMTVASMHVHRSHHAVVALKGRVFAIGGSTSNFTCLSSVEMYEPAQDKWTMVNSLPGKRRGASAAVLGDCIYLTGGDSCGGDGFGDASADAYRFCTNTMKWEVIPSMREPRRDHASAVMNNQLFACGGSNMGGHLSSCEKYDAMHDQWSSIPHMPLPLVDFGMTADGMRLFTFGGSTSNSITDNVFTFKENTWTKLHSMPAHLKALAVAYAGWSAASTVAPTTTPTPDSTVTTSQTTTKSTPTTQTTTKSTPTTPTTTKSTPTQSTTTVGPINGQVVFVLGGAGQTSSDSVASAFRYYPAHPAANREKWLGAPGMTVQRADFGAAAVGNSLFAVGGRGNSSADGSALNSVERFDSTNYNWTMAAPMLVRRANHAVVALKGRVFAIGGRDHQFKCLPSVEMYEPAHDKWTMVASLPEQRRGASAAVMGDCIYVTGGDDCGRGRLGSARADSYKYCAATMKWEGITAMTEARRYHASAVMNDELYVCGGDGSDGRKQLSSCEKYDATNGKWSAIAHLPQRLDNFGMTAVGSQIFTFGGFSNNLVADDVYTYKKNAWTKLHDMPAHREALAVAQISWSAASTTTTPTTTTKT